MDRSQQSFQNHLLRSIPVADLDLILPHLKPARLTLRLSFEETGVPIDTVCFPDSGIISVVAKSRNDRQIEAGLIGYEGMTGVSVLMGDDRSPNATYVQLPGFGHTLSAEVLRSAMRASTFLRDRLLQYAHTFVVQTAQTALANGRAKIDERLARWLLMADDRTDGSELSFTHEFLSLMLGVRRPGVTDALHRLEGDLLIRSRRGVISVRDRRGLERMADASYGVPEAEYRRLFGALSRTNGQKPAAIFDATSDTKVSRPGN